MERKSSEEIPSGVRIYLSNPWNLIKTGFLVLTWIVLVNFIYFNRIFIYSYFILKAFHLELVGPTLPILAANTHVDYNGMGSALASRGAGYLVANILGIILQNIVKKHSDGILVCAYVLPAIGKILLSLNKNINFLF